MLHFWQQRKFTKKPVGEEADAQVEEEEEEGGRKGMEMRRRLRQLQANGQLKVMGMAMLTPRSRRPTRMTR